MLSTPLYFAAWDDDVDCWAVRRRADVIRGICESPLFARCANGADARQTAAALNEHDAVMTPRAGWVGPAAPATAAPFVWPSRRDDWRPDLAALPPMQEQSPRYSPMFGPDDALAARMVG